jgi:hypothetical protein
MAHGFDSIYISLLSAQTRPRVTGTPGSIPYFESVYETLKNIISKPEVIVEIVNDILITGNIPPVISDVKAKLENIL